MQPCPARAHSADAEVSTDPCAGSTVDKQKQLRRLASPSEVGAPAAPLWPSRPPGRGRTPSTEAHWGPLGAAPKRA
eukprot:15453193-Alexandrium_andersonii.AAC.1